MKHYKAPLDVIAQKVSTSYIYIMYFENLFGSSFLVRHDELANIVSVVVGPLFLPQNPLLREKRSGELKACMVLIELYIYNSINIMHAFNSLDLFSPKGGL